MSSPRRSPGSAARRRGALGSRKQLSFSSCQKNTITGRKQLILVNEADLQQMALTEYKKFLTQNKVITQGASKEQEMVNRAGKRIANAVAVFATKQG